MPNVEPVVCQGLMSVIYDASVSQAEIVKLPGE